MNYGNLLQIDDTLISSDLLQKKFCCDLQHCKGICCVKGDAGAPMTAEEVALLPQLIEAIKPYLRPEGVAAIEEQGTHVIDEEGETVTPLVQGAECAYVIFEGGIVYCGIEKAYNAGVISFQKPLSCHLYPVRIRKYKEFTAVNYDRWDICKGALSKGQEVNVKVFEFVKDALIRRFGTEWYEQLTLAARELERGEL